MNRLGPYQNLSLARVNMSKQLLELCLTVLVSVSSSFDRSGHSFPPETDSGTSAPPACIVELSVNGGSERGGPCMSRGQTVPLALVSL